MDVRAVFLFCKGGLPEFVKATQQQKGRVFLVPSCSEAPTAIHMAAVLIGATLQERIYEEGICCRKLPKHTFSYTTNFRRRNADLVKVSYAKLRSPIVFFKAVSCGPTVGAFYHHHLVQTWVACVLRCWRVVPVDFVMLLTERSWAREIKVVSFFK